jgi:S-(hydroxymethyl)glutathione dehydrogenase / alcohol dehydrogenase
MAFKSLSRRSVLKAAGLAAVTSGASGLFAGSLSAQQGAPGVLTNAQAGRKFRALVKHNMDAPSVVELTVRGVAGRQVLIRTEAAQTCYSNADQVVLGDVPIDRAEIVGHGGIGVVEAVGPQVAHVRVGDRVIVTDWSSCGWCFNCLRMRSDKCMARGPAVDVPTANMADGTPVFSSKSGMSELMIVQEEYAIPIFTQLPAPELAMLHCVGTCGLGMATTNCAVEMASDVVVFGAGPVGLSAIQGARIKGAAKIIVVEPIPYRRELAMKLGATDGVDPNQFKDRKLRAGAPGSGDARGPAANATYDDNLVQHIRDLCKQKNDRLLAGGARVGPDHVIEAVGGDRMKPKEVQGPDPSGVTVLQQCWELCSSTGTLATSSVGHPVGAMVQIPASQWADGAKHHWPGTAGGTNPRRDEPRYIKLMETGQLNMKALASKTFPLSQAKQAYQECADRTVVATIVTPNV